MTLAIAVYKKTYNAEDQEYDVDRDEWEVMDGRNLEGLNGSPARCARWCLQVQ